MQTPAKKNISPPIIFFVARGAANSCGEGCDTWIAAHGEFDSGAAARLKQLLARVGKRDLPIFFFSPGGSGREAIAIGKMMRDRKMRAGVARTIPADCKDGEFSDSCNALRRAYRDLPSTLNTLATCASACVYALLGAQTRDVSANAALAVHSSRIVLMRNGRRVEVKGALVAYAEKRSRIFEGEVDRYTKSMGIDLELLKVARSVPFESSRKLTREEIFKFGIDKRESGDSGWRYVAERSRQFVTNVAFYRHGGETRGNAFATTSVFLSCFANGQLRVVTETRTSSSPFNKQDIALVFGSERIVLAPSSTPQKPDEPEWRWAIMSAAAATQLWLSNEVKLDVSGPAVKLDASGLKSALGSLRETCMPPDVART